jgi:phage shock protein PspC (stress-responsive transcriptional regulator)
MRRLHKSRHNRVFSGVCGGIGEYFNIDPSLVRILFILFGITGAGLIAYIAAVLILPYDDEVT